jgi:iron complex transport system permease protein
LTGIGQGYPAWVRPVGQSGLWRAMIAALIVAAIAFLAIGARSLSPDDVIAAFLAYDPGNFDHHALWQFRLPRLLAAIVVGACLALSGALLQTMVRNPLAEPQLLGLNAGASLAVVTVSVFGTAMPDVSRPLIAAAGATVAFCLTMGLSGIGRGGPTPLKMTLCGIIVSAFASSLTSALLLLDEQAIEELRLWLSGDLGGQSLARLTTVLPFASVGAVLAFLIAPKLELLALGDDVARGLGVSLGRTRLITALSAALLSGAAVSLAGPIGLIGLVVPHLLRQALQDGLRRLLLACLIAGPLLLIVADLLARNMIAPVEISTGVMTGFAGAIAFIALVVRYLR